MDMYKVLFDPIFDEETQKPVLQIVLVWPDGRTLRSNKAVDTVEQALALDSGVDLAQTIEEYGGYEGVVEAKQRETTE